MSDQIITLIFTAVFGTGIASIWFRLGRIEGHLIHLNGRADEAAKVVERLRAGCPLCPKDRE